MSPDPHPPDDQGPDSTDAQVRRAVRYGVIVLGFGIATLVVALLSSGALRTVLVIVAPAVVGVGALGALWHTYRQWRARGRWQVWQGASWFLLASFVVFLFATAPFLVSG
ncbi:hypothetical protein GYA93_06900 [Gordonia desulfuricans]|uniref:Transmembrane protein n=1 Tax=Gordonia desulfuricans TaxID=89051 RepID=A0A7K3LM32_9ACTN|nr:MULTISPECIES: hypothetical protein [Gordonia]KOY49093.1 hypothetical protein ISGA_12500 [Gordonia sp. NB41Y]NDK89312.1 hypothetical protein [Gordonia desulfuricans]WLP91818.1 hypothetical protein Q9K23_06105 [Gordonia sp. NB41Y]